MKSWRARVRRDAMRCAAATTLAQLDGILAELVADVMQDDAAIARARGLPACADVIDRRADALIV